MRVLITDLHNYRWIAQYLPEILKESMMQLLESERFVVVYDEYNWLINAS